MNKRRILVLARRLETGRTKYGSIDPVGFDLATWSTPSGGGFTWKPDGSVERTACGTAACIAGHAAMAWGSPLLDHFRWRGLRYFEEGQRILGLTDDQAKRLFVPSASDLGEPVEAGAAPDSRVAADSRARRSVTPIQAARVLRRLAETGEVDWSKRGPGPQAEEE